MMKVLTKLQPYCETCPYFDGVLENNDISFQRQKVYPNGSAYPFQPDAERTIEIHCENENICKRVAEISTSTALAYEKEMASIGKPESVQVSVQAVDDIKTISTGTNTRATSGNTKTTVAMKKPEGSKKLMQGYQDRFDTVVRKMKMNTTAFQVGDQVTIPLEGFGIFTATAQKVGPDGTLFLFDDSVVTREMNEDNVNEGGYAASELRKWIDEKLFVCFPRDWQFRILELTLPTYGQIFGHDDFYEKVEPDEDEQFPLMKDRKNRIAFLKDVWEWYWLKNATKKNVSAARFATVDAAGTAYCNVASLSLGVRPVFLVG
jgi:hypothetical protein